ncbi:hypothetical protein N7466_007159 [Penicillium verhagenii]|uniref:uncharacterized protein n=1 Tax=Penicillium verhagenii TaxID=1562060 RepID=UPI0025458EDA|nr:uncharacterized protein N7466_007159 [Penicillium verhagenii]KAJ5928203.1 hypothetical protein N7466_007159 [Penicillium verhagenii]
MPTSTTSLSASTTTASATSTCTTMTAGKNGYLPPDACNVILYYVPSLAAAIVFCLLFGMTLMAHVMQAIIHKKRYAMVIIMGCLWEVTAFVFRSIQTHNQSSNLINTLYTIFFLLAPIWINAFLYMTLGRMINFYMPNQKLRGISARRFGMIFVCLDIFAFLVQMVGAAFTTSTNAKKDVILFGIHIYMGGIGLQEFFIIGFTFMTIQLHLTMVAMERMGHASEKMTNGSFPWRWLFYTIYFALTMITIRIVFRLVQYAQGYSTTNPILLHEVYEYVFDASPMFLALFAVNCFHPGRVLQGEGSKFKKISRAEKKQQKALAKLQEDEQRHKEQAMRSVDEFEMAPAPHYV